MPQLTFHGHSCFTLETSDGTRIMFDPWLDENPASELRVKDVEKLDYILVSHGHSDHFADCVKLAKKTGATVVSTFELVA
ncbi:MAG TPA: MBL fold metallo-hydrolase, partial [Longimicrobium sp.]